MKLGGSTAPAQPEVPTNAAPAGPEETPLDFTAADTSAPAADKPFDDQPFDAGVEADEASDPKKFIEQLTGKLGQSLRKYSEEQGNPDFELEKFAINSVLSATHTGEMDPQDQGDIIKKVKDSGANDGSEEIPAEAPTEDQPEEVPADDANNTFDSEPSEEESLKELGLGDHRTKTLLTIYDKGSDAVKKILTRLVSFSNKINRVTFLRDVQEDLDPDDMDYVFDRIRAIGVPIPNDEPSLNEDEGMILNNPKKNNMFQKGSNDKLKEIEDIAEEKLQNGEKKSIIVDKSPLKESLNQDDMAQPAQPITKPKVKPETKPIIQPRKNRPFLPNVTPDVRPDPKGVKEENPEASMVDPKVAKAEKKKALNYPIYHETFSSAVQAGRAFAEAKGYTIDDDEWYFQVSTGPKKPSVGITNRYTLELLKGGNVQKMHMHMQIYNMGTNVTPYELNAYIA